jgi:hypothetical protein
VPRRPPSHVIADQAVGAVVQMLVDACHAVHHVVHDYGEDLLIETSHSGRIDATRLWIQVKVSEPPVFGSVTIDAPSQSRQF